MYFTTQCSELRGKVRFLLGYLMYFTLRCSGLGVKYNFTSKSTVNGSDGIGPSEVHRSPSAAANGQNSIVSKKNGRDRRASIVTPADGGLRLMTVDCGG